MSRKAKNQKSGLGRTLLRHAERSGGGATTSSRHTTLDYPSEVSVTENTSLDEFLSNARAAQRSFEAERTNNVRIVDTQEATPVDQQGSRSGEEEDEIEDEENESPFLMIPRKPDWRHCNDSDEFERLEQMTFVRWKSRLHKSGQNLPPFEKNLEFWKQLWKMVEMSDVVVQVVDARDPLFYFSHDLSRYVHEVDERKVNVVMLNKADLLLCHQRESWTSYFAASDMKVIYFSALNDGDENTGSDEEAAPNEMLHFNTSRILSPPEVLQLLRQELPSLNPLTVGFLGYPNVGKSSTINRFLLNKRLQVSATPGKTKHYQSHVLQGGSITLVDGPGLVIPNLNMTKAQMVLAGILPIDNLTNFQPAVDLLLTRIPFSHLTEHYGIMQSCVKGAKEQGKALSIRFLSALGLMRGFMKPGGIPDQFRAAKLVLKDYVQGKLLFVNSPPGLSQEEFGGFKADSFRLIEDEDMSLEESFPELRLRSGVHIRGKGPIGAFDKKHGNKKKREKARRLYNDPYM